MKPISWSNTGSVPAIGSQVNIRTNNIGLSIVIGYLVAEGESSDYIALKIKPINPPEWYINQNGKDYCCVVFGQEL